MKMYLNTSSCSICIKKSQFIYIQKKIKINIYACLSIFLFKIQTYKNIQTKVYFYAVFTYVTFYVSDPNTLT